MFKKQKVEYERPPFQLLLLVIAVLLLVYVFNLDRDHFTPDRKQILDSLGVKVVPVPEDDNTDSAEQLNNKTDNPDSHDGNPP